jgi:hypothetical protein
MDKGPIRPDTFTRAKGVLAMQEKGMKLAEIAGLLNLTIRHCSRLAGYRRKQEQEQGETKSA